QPAEAGSKHGANTESTKSDESKTAEKPSTDEADPAAEIQLAPDETGKTTDAAAAAIAVAIVAAEVPAPAAAPAATPPAGAAGPLGIAAAAIAASNAASEAAATPVADAGKKTAKAGAQAIAGETITTAQAKDAAATPVVTSAVPAAPQTTAAAKAPTAASDAAASTTDTGPPTSSKPAPAAGTAAAPAPTGTEQPATAKPNVKNAQATPAKAEAAGTDTTSATAAHLDTAHHDTAPGQSNAPASTAQAIASFQPPSSTIATQAPPSFTVTAASQSAAVPLSGLAMEIAASVRSGKSRFEIRLDPADLGRIDVRIDVDRNGQVTSHLTVEKPETLSMLRQDAPQLQRALNDAGLSTGNGGLQFSLRDQSSQGQNGNQSNPNAHRLILSEEETVPSAVVGGYGRMFGANGGVDIRV
ncbi:MAG: flagellar hook-length control protein FliK, partial [Bradyrhizobium sp.]